MTIDGFWADANGRSVFPIDDLHRCGLLDSLIQRTGAVIWSQRSFDSADDPDWYACNYEYQVPIVVVKPAPPCRPKEDCGLRFVFVEDFEAALEAAAAACGERDVMIIGEAGMVQVALSSGRVDEFYLRLVQTIIGRGEALLGLNLPRTNFVLDDVARTDSCIHLHLIRRA